MQLTNKRYSKERILLKRGEAELSDKNLFVFRWTDNNRVRHAIYAKTLDELRKKEDSLNLNRLEGINSDGMYLTLNDMYHIWCETKRGLKDNTFSNYKYMYNTYVSSTKFGNTKLSNIKKTDVKRFYNGLKDSGSLKTSTIEGIHNVVHQVLQLAVEDDYIRKNPSDNVLREFKKSHNIDTEPRKALTVKEEQIFLDYLKRTPKYYHWYPIFCVLAKTGMRSGECTGLRWQDIDFDNKTISINHTLVYYDHNQSGCRFAINSTKTVASKRIIPMTEEVVNALIQEKEFQNELGLKSKARINGYSDFIFINKDGNCQHFGTLNKALNRIIRDCNDEILLNNPDSTDLLPHFSCHTFRHTFTTRMIEAGLNPKFVQDILGHSDISTTLNIYADCTQELRDSSIKKLEEFYRANE